MPPKPADSNVISLSEERRLRMIGKAILDSEDRIHSNFRDFNWRIRALENQFRLVLQKLDRMFPTKRRELHVRRKRRRRAKR